MRNDQFPCVLRENPRSSLPGAQIVPSFRSFVSQIRPGHVLGPNEESDHEEVVDWIMPGHVRSSPLMMSVRAASNQYKVWYWPSRNNRRIRYRVEDVGTNWPRLALVGTKSHESPGVAIQWKIVKNIGHFLWVWWNIAFFVLCELINRNIGRRKKSVPQCQSNGQEEEIATGTVGGSDDQLRGPEWPPQQRRKRQESSPQNSWLGLLQHQFR